MFSTLGNLAGVHTPVVIMTSGDGADILPTVLHPPSSLVERLNNNGIIIPHFLVLARFH